MHLVLFLNEWLVALDAYRNRPSVAFVLSLMLMRVAIHQQGNADKSQNHFLWFLFLSAGVLLDIQKHFTVTDSEAGLLQTGTVLWISLYSVAWYPRPAMGLLPCRSQREEERRSKGPHVCLSFRTVPSLSQLDWQHYACLGSCIHSILEEGDAIACFLRFTDAQISIIVCWNEWSATKDVKGIRCSRPFLDAVFLA